METISKSYSHSAFNRRGNTIPLPLPSCPSASKSVSYRLPFRSRVCFYHNHRLLPLAAPSGPLPPPPATADDISLLNSSNLSSQPCPFRRGGAANLARAKPLHITHSLVRPSLLPRSAASLPLLPTGTPPPRKFLASSPLARPPSSSSKRKGKPPSILC